MEINHGTAVGAPHVVRLRPARAWHGSRLEGRYGHLPMTFEGKVVLQFTTPLPYAGLT